MVVIYDDNDRYWSTHNSDMSQLDLGSTRLSVTAW